MTSSQRKALATFSDMLLKSAEDTYEHLFRWVYPTRLIKRIPKGVNRRNMRVIRQAISDAQQLIQQNPDSYVHTSAFGSNRKNNQSPFTQRDFEEYVPIAKPTDRNYNDYLDSLKAVTSSCRDDKSLYALREDLISNIPETIPEQDRDTYKKLIHQMIMEARSLNKMRSALLEAKKPGEQSVLDLDDPDNLILLNQLADALTSPNFNEEQLRKKVVDPSRPGSDVKALVLEEALNKAKYLVNKYPDTFREQPKQASLRDLLTQTKLSAFDLGWKAKGPQPFMSSHVYDALRLAIDPNDPLYDPELKDLLEIAPTDEDLEEFRKDMFTLAKRFKSESERAEYQTYVDNLINEVKRYNRMREELLKVYDPKKTKYLHPNVPDDLLLIGGIADALNNIEGNEKKLKEKVLNLLNPWERDYRDQEKMLNEAIYYAKHLNNKSPKTFKNQNIQTPKQASEQEIVNKKKKPDITNLPPEQYQQLLDAKLMEQYYKSILPTSVAKATTTSSNPITLAVQKARARRILKPIAKAYKIRRKMMEQYYLNNMDNNQPMQ